MNRNNWLSARLGAHFARFPAMRFWMVGPMHCSRDPQVLFFSKIIIKTGSHGTIHTFKIYFATVFSVFNNKRYPNRP